MNRTQNPDFFRCWDLSKSLADQDYRMLSAKEQIEHDILVEHFADTYGFYPTKDYQEVIHTWLEIDEIQTN